ncbi:hypothetical protein O1611_g5548 [Lasiodiplodia mahajangana]|uniref:Uncharacterized protein n=1 Tax=Lasiodiplodia mahajangana TaxID=1108764 RepID=A0ACC2JL49_9PEZI|nr:hypothetical protein O1611_g5548 [Lasiodiplodia mahajangana]
MQSPKQLLGNKSRAIAYRSHSTMAPKSFHLFTSLPFELRWMIYLLATPPRFVYVKEAHEDRDEFIERLRTEPLQVRLHPSIAYFARNWRDHVRTASDRQRQMTLDMFGLTCPPPRHQPWESTSEVPGIPHRIICDDHAIAWEFLRKSALYSAAPIPALLHVSAESRHVLMSAGYELTFQTRSCGPLIWFNFKTDVLFIPYFDEYRPDDRVSYSLLSGSMKWDIGQFEPRDLTRVKRLALERAGGAVISRARDDLPQISSLLHLFGNVEELFLEEGGVKRGVDLAGSRRPEDIEGLWSHTPPMEVDILAALSRHQDDIVHSTGFYHQDLIAYKEMNMGDGSGYFVDAARKFEERLATKRDELVRRERLTPWKIPTVKIVYIIYPSGYRKLTKWRWETWYNFQGLKEQEDRLRAAEQARRSIDVPRRPIYDDQARPLSPFSAQFQDEEEVYAEMFEYDFYTHGFFDAYEPEGNRREWQFNNPTHSDVKIYIGEYELSAHAIVLANRSLFFEKALSGRFREGQTKEFRFTEGSMHAHWRVFEYMYTGSYSEEPADGLGTIQDDDELAKDVRVYVTADFFLLEDLKQIALTKLKSKLYDLQISEPLVGCIREIYTSTTESGHDLRNAVMETAVDHGPGLWKINAFRDLVHEGGDFVVELKGKRKETKMAKQLSPSKPCKVEQRLSLVTQIYTSHKAQRILLM